MIVVIALAEDIMIALIAMVLESLIATDAMVMAYYVALIAKTDTLNVLIAMVRVL